MWRLEPPHKKRRLSRTVSLYLYNLADDHAHDTRGEHPAHQQQQFEGTGTADDPASPLLLLLPAAPSIPDVSSATYAAYLAALPLRITFKTRITNSQLAAIMYPAALVDESVRLYYPDYRSFNSLLHDGILPRLRVAQRDAIRTLKMVAKKDGEILFVSEFMCAEEQWEAALAELRTKDVSRAPSGGGGMGNAFCVRLLVGLDCETY